MERALQLKDEGNRHFQKGDYAGAESLYSQAYVHLTSPLPHHNPPSLSPPSFLMYPC